MDFLDLPFKLLTITGYWKPVSWTTRRKKLIWIPYSIATTFLVFLELVTLVGYLVLSTNLSEFSDRLFFIPTSLSTVQKVYIMIRRRKQLINLTDMFLIDLCLPKTAKEVLIENEYKLIIRNVTLACTVLVNLTATNLVLLPIFLGGISTKLMPIKVWLPYPMNSQISYWLSYMHQSMSIYLVATGAVGSTLMITGFMYQICAQFHILSSRFDALPRIVEKLKSLNIEMDRIRHFEIKAFKQNVEHHRYIIRLSKIVNDTFKSVIFQQFCLTAIVVSATIYQLSTKPEKNMEFMMVFFYLLCVLTECLVYCWFGNELMLESLNFQEAIYSMDWSVLTTSAWKDMVFIMLRTTKPIIMYCGHFIVLSLESYISILKVSYSVFNILRRS